MLLPSHDEFVRPEWIDSNGHMNLAYYIVVFDQALDVVFDSLDIGTAYRRRSGSSTFAVETHTLYLREVIEGEAVRVTSRLLGVDAKRLHWFQEMHHLASGEIAASLEQMNLHIDLRTRRVAPWPADRLAALRAATDPGPWPQAAGRRIALPGGRVSAPPVGDQGEHERAQDR
ncbi:MAG TPA: thioesterase family protein [Acetobacteraceae bacterium]